MIDFIRVAKRGDDHVGERDEMRYGPGHGVTARSALLRVYRTFGANLDQLRPSE